MQPPQSATKARAYWSSPPHMAEIVNNPEEVKRLLNAGADVNVTDNEDGLTPLHHAARENAPEAAKTLIERGADVKAKDENGWMPLDLARDENAGTAVAELLINAALANGEKE